MEIEIEQMEEWKEVREESEEWEKEEGILDHWSHTHPLCLVEASRDTELASDIILCHGCLRSRRWRNNTLFQSEDQMYVCSKRCGSDITFHKECAEIPRKIKHPMHPQHILMIQEYLDSEDYECAFCKIHIKERMCYSCTSSKCHSYFHMHLRCAQAWGPMDADDVDADADADDEQEQEQKQKQKKKQKQSRLIIHDHHHPEHELMFVSRRAGGSHSFRCDACGTKERGNSYLCTVCDQFWIHQKCASLPDSITMPYHHHPLSLSLLFPLQYFRSGNRCSICYAQFNPKYWVYYCQICHSFVVHIKCAFKQVARYPLTYVVDESITPFVEAIRGKIAAFNLGIKYEVPFHKHRLSLIRPPPPSSSSSHGDQNSDDDEEYEGKSEHICDGCITPILSYFKQHKYILSCSECKYILHRVCSQLPPQLPSLPLHNHHDHELVLQSCTKLEFEAKCQVCNLYTNGLMYACKTCDFKADIKCAVLPDSIHHEGHYQRHLLSHFIKKEMRNVKHARCDAGQGCGLFNDDSDCYVCGTCDFTLHVGCALLPKAIMNRTWDNHHPLKLTYGTATLNDFYCDCCEEKMNPEEWVYRCDDSCDLSFHPRCFLALSGEYRNIKFGQKYTIATAHPHPLAYQLLTTKRRCDICRRDSYGLRGFQCAPCNFFICFDTCAQPLLQDARIQIVDES